MKADKAVISQLNRVLTTELTSINHYFLHARMFKNWGLTQLNDRTYKKSIEDMKQADALIERILFLEGLPNLQQLNPIMIGEHTAEMLASDMKFELSQLDELREAIVACEQAKDFVSRELLEDILEEEEEYVDWLEAQEYLLQQTGLENYLQSQI